VPSRSAHVSHALNTHDTQPEPWSVCELLARRGHQRCHCNEEGFGTTSRQLGNDEGYRSSCPGVSGRFTRWPTAFTHGPTAAVGTAKDARNGTGRPRNTGPSFDAWAGSATAF
jgi:hypothetical protein